MNCNTRIRIPTLLQELLELSSRNQADPPNFECQAGWCQQCQCSLADIQNHFGEVEYIVEPSLPTIAGTILPCVSRRLVPTIDIEHLLSVCKNLGGASHALKRSSGIWARIAPELVGQVYNVTTPAGKIITSTEIGHDSVVVKRNLNDPSGVNESIVQLDQFINRYGIAPRNTFEQFYDHVGIHCYRIEQSLIDQLSEIGTQPYVKVNNDVFSLVHGDVITLSGGFIKVESLKRDFQLEKIQAEPADGIHDSTPKVNPT